MTRVTAALAAISFSMLLPSAIGARDVSRSAQLFGDISYEETVSSRSKEEPAFVGIPDTEVNLSVDVPIPIGSLTIEDRRGGMSIGLNGKRCRVFTGVDGYRDLSIAEIEHRLPQLRSDCDWSAAAIANTMSAIEGKAEDLQNAVEHMRQRAIALLGSDLRCDPATPPPKPSTQPPVMQMVLDGLPPTPCHDTGATRL